MRKLPSMQALFILAVIALVFLAVVKGPFPTGYVVLKDAEVFAGKDSYGIGEMAHLFVVPSDADYDLEVYDPDGKLYAVSADFPVEKPGKYVVGAVLKSGNETRKVRTTFKVAEEGAEKKKETKHEAPEPNSEPEAFEEEAILKEDTEEEYRLVNFKGPKDYSIGDKDIDFTENDMQEEDFFDEEGSPKKKTKIEKDGIKIDVRGAGKDKLKNAWFNKGVLHVDSVDIDGATISLPHEKLAAITIAPRLYVKEENETEFKLAKPYRKNGKSYHEIEITDDDYTFNVGHFTDYYVNSSGGDYATLTECLFALNNSADACAINEPGLWDINNSYNFYFTATAMKINSENVTLDCNGSYFLGDNSGTDYGIYSIDYNNITVRNCSFEKFYTGIHMQNSDYHNLHGNVLYDNVGNGIYAENSEFNNITNNTANVNAKGIILYSGSHNNTIANNTANSNTDYGIYLYQSSRNYIADNRMASNTDAGVFVAGTCWNNTIRNNTVQGSSTQGGIYFTGQRNFILENNLTNNINGVYLSSSSNSIVANNTITSGNWQGVYINLGDHNIILDNTISGYNAGGVYITGTTDNNITNNTFSSNGYGVYLNRGSRNMLINNTFVSSSLHSIDIRALVPAANTSITGNTIYSSGNGYLDLYIYPGASNTTVWLNNFYDEGIFDAASDSNFCVDSQGNFYKDTIAWSKIGSNDCGPSQITYPAGGDTFFNKSVPIRINWTAQSSQNTIDYYLYYSDDAGASWYNIIPDPVETPEADMVLAMSFNTNHTADNITVDYSNESNNGTVRNGAVWTGTGGHPGGAYEFDGDVDRNMRIDLPNDFLDSYSEGTLMLWFKTNTDDINNQFLFGANNEGSISDSRFWIRLKDGNYVTMAGGEIANTLLSWNSSISFTTGDWVHFAYTTNASGNWMYINGTYVAGTYTVGSGSNVFFYNTTEVRPETTHNAIAALWYGTDNYIGVFNGTIDSVMIFNRSLSASEIQQIYNESIAGLSTTDLEYNWSIDNAALGNYTLKVIPNDGIYNATINHSGVFRIRESNPPSISSVALSSTSSNNFSSDNLTAVPSGVSDSDGDAVQVNYNWYLNGTSDTVLNMPFTEPDDTGGNRTYDTSGYDNHGNVSGATFNATGGYDGFGAFEFDGVDDYVDLDGTSLQLNYTKTGLSVSLWAKANEVDVGSQVIFKNNGFRIAQSGVGSGSISWLCENSTGDAIGINIASSWDDTEWHHFVGTVNESGYMNLYKDGSNIGANQINGSANVNAYDVFIGSQLGTGEFFNGTIDEVRLYNRSLSADEIALLYSNRTNTTHSDAISAGQNWTVKATPIDALGLNGSSVFSNQVIIITQQDNQKVCSDVNICEYADITSALDGENNTNKTIYLVEENKTYTISKAASYKFYPSSPAINISAENITFDCNGSSINGNGTGEGIYSNGYDNITIRNCTVANFSNGIYFWSSNYDLLLDNIVYNNTHAIYLRNFDFSEVINNTMTNNSNHSIYMYNGCDNNTFINNTVIDSKYPVYLHACTNNTLTGNTITNGSIRGIFLSSDANNNILKDNIMENNGQRDIDLFENSGNRIINNSINVNAKQYAIYLQRSSNNTIANNTINDSLFHSIYIQIYGTISDANNITGNTIMNTGSGYFDLYINATNTSIWLNNFYSRGVNITDSLNTSFCVNNQGNFYRETISWLNMGPGDCGPANITYPFGGEIFRNSSAPIKINWTAQSSQNTINYYLYYSNDTGANWYNVISADTDIAEQTDTGKVLSFSFNTNHTSSRITTDYSGNGNNGSVNGATWNATGGYNGEAGYEFDGNDDYINLGDNTSLKPSLPVTISLWLKRKETAVFFANDDTTSKYCGVWAQFLANGSMRATYGNCNGGGSPAYRESADTHDVLETGRWYHVVVIYRGNANIDIFFNGTNMSKSYSGTGNTLGYNPSTNATLGAASQGTTGFFNGSIDSFMMFNRSLSASEIQQIYNESIAGLSTTDLEYNWTISGVDDGNYLLKLVPFDGTYNATINQTGEFEIKKNFPPTISSVILNATSTSNLTTDNLTANPDGVSDADGDPVTLNYNWYKDGISDTVLNMPFTAPDSNNQTYDLSGYGNNGLVVNNTFWNSTGGYDGSGAFEFDEDSIINITPSNDFPTTEGAISLWVRFGEWDGFKDIIDMRNDGVNNNRITFERNNNFPICANPSLNAIHFLISNGTGDGFSAICSNTQFNTGSWYHIVGTWNSTTISMYINGTLDSSGTAADISRPTLPANEMLIGGTSYWSNRLFNGTIDDVRIYNRSLSADEIALLYSNRTNTTHYSATSGGENWTVKATPIDTYGENGTTLSSNGVIVRIDNNYVCSDNSLCEYQNIIQALDDINNTNENITLAEANTVYAMPANSSYSISPDGGEEIAIKVNATNATLDCNGSELKGILDFNTSGLILSYDFELGLDNVTDLSGYGHNATINNDADYATGYRGTGGMGFDGDSDYLNSTQIMGGNTLSYGAWVKYNAFNPAVDAIIGQFNDDASDGFVIFSTNTGGSHYAFCYNGSLEGISSVSTLSAGTWYHIMCVHNGTGMCLYFNGVKENCTYSTRSAIAGDFVIGGLPQNGTGYWFNGSLDQVRVYNRSLSDAEVLEHYNWGRGYLGIGINANNATIKDCDIYNYSRAIIVQNSNYSDIVNNTIDDSLYYDLNLTSTVQETSTWLNNFYSKGADDSGTANNYCVNNKGNFYEEDIAVSAIGNGTGESGGTIGGDCGPARITMASDLVFQDVYSMILNWTNQSTKDNVSYYLYYKNTSASNWNYITTTGQDSYNWSIIMLDNGDYTVKLVPFDDTHNATNDISPLFTINQSRFITLINQTKNVSGNISVVNETESVWFGQNLTINVNVTSLLNSISSVWIKIWESIKGVSAVIWEGMLSLMSGNTTTGVWGVNITVNESFERTGLYNYTIYANETATNYTFEFDGNFSVRTDNFYVCANDNICRFNNITGALTAANNTNNTVTLLDSGTTYSITSNSRFNITPVNGSPVISINASNAVLDCNDVRFTGTNISTGIIIRNHGTAVIRECYLSNFSIGIILDNSSNNNITQNTIIYTAAQDMNITSTSHNSQIWSNNFYGEDVMDYGSGNIFCYNGDTALSTGSSMMVSYNFQENGTAVEDKSGNGKTGILYPNETSGPQRTRGKYFKSLEFDGLNDYLSLAPGLSFDSDKNFTIEAWFRTSDSSQTLLGLNRSFSDVFDIDAIDPLYTVYGEDSYNALGRSVASGDINGDGYADLILGAPGSDPPGGHDAGAVYVIFTEPGHKTIDLNITSANITLYGDNQSDMLGDTVASADINNDGFDDLIIGSPRAAFKAGGLIYVIFGRNFTSPTTIDFNATPAAASMTVKSQSTYDYFGQAIATGDINNDGYADMILGTGNGNPGYRADAGITYVVFGRNFTSGTAIDLASDPADITVEGNSTFERSGSAVASGDVNGDGYDDLIIGAYHASTRSGESMAGKAYVVFGGNFSTNISVNLSSVPANITVEGEDALDLLGWTVASGDINNDSYHDIIVGAKNAAQNKGKAYIIFGSAVTTPERIDLSSDSANITLIGKTAYDYLGMTLGSGDVNNDSYDDIIVSAPYADPESRTNAGEAYVIYGYSFASPTTIDLASVSANMTIYGNDADDNLGAGILYSSYYTANSLDSADMNNDGFDEILIGAYSAEPGIRDSAGEAYVIDASKPVLEINIDSNGRLQASVGGGNGSVTSQGTTAVDDNSWHYVALVKNPSIRIYVDGALQDTDSYIYENFVLSEFFIGALNNHGQAQNFFNGTIDSVTLYNRSLSHTEIGLNYLRGKGTGNFYREASNRSNIEFSLDDCGISEITAPEQYQNFTGTTRINWTSQTVNTGSIAYYLYYTNNSGADWYGLGSISNNFYLWGVSALPDGDDYYIKIIPYDSNYNATNAISDRFGIHNRLPNITFINQTNLSSIPVNETYPARSGEIVRILVNATETYGLDTVWISVRNGSHTSPIVWEGLFSLFQGTRTDGIWEINMTVNESFPEVGFANYTLSANGSLNNTAVYLGSLYILDNEWLCSNISLCEYQSFGRSLLEENNTENSILLLDSNATYAGGNGRYYNLQPPSGRGAIQFNASNITIDCQGSTFIGNHSGYGAFINGFDEMAIINCRFRDYHTGINFTDSTDSNVSIAESSSNSMNGIWLDNFYDGSLIDVNASGNTGSNINMLRSDRNSFNQINASNSSGIGLNLTNSSNNTFNMLIFEKNNKEAMYINPLSSRDAITNSTFENSTSGHLFSIYGDYNNISRSTFRNSAAGYFDLFIATNSQTNILWLNNFYTHGINDSGFGTVYCKRVLSNLEDGVYTVTPVTTEVGNYYSPSMGSTYAPAGSCGALSEPFDDSDSDSYYSILEDCDDDNIYTYPFAPEFCDDFDNDCDGTADEGVCVTEKFPSAGTGASGGAPMAGYSIGRKEKTQNISENPIVVLYKGETVSFIIKGEESRVRLDKLYFDKANLSIPSVNDNFIFKINESLSFDIDGDGIEDMDILLSSIEDAAVFEIREVTAGVEKEIAVTPEEVMEEKEPEAEVLPAVEEPSAVISIGKSILKYFVIAIIILAIIISLAAGAVSYSRFIGNVSRAEEYVREAMGRGIPKTRIRRKLIESGWERQVVDSILRMESKTAMKKSLEEEIKEAMGRGVSKDKIKESLIKKGWEESDIDKILK